MAGWKSLEDCRDSFPLLDLHILESQPARRVLPGKFLPRPSLPFEQARGAGRLEGMVVEYKVQPVRVIFKSKRIEQASGRVLIARE